MRSVFFVGNFVGERPVWFVIWIGHNACLTEEGGRVPAQQTLPE